MIADYSAFVTRKLSTVPPTGIPHAASIALPDGLFDHQRVLTRWALRRGRCAIFADTGLGKTRIELAWSNAVHQFAGHDVMMLAPLAVAAQTVREGVQIGIPVTLCRDASDVRPGINITNYERLHKFDLSRFGGIVPDESSCIKNHGSKVLAHLLEACRDTPFKLAATATPAPNDWTELGTHAEFLGICTRVEMLSEYFVHDGGDTQTWRLKGHARDAFWAWVASWAALVRKPSDLGFDDTRYVLPPLNVHQHISKADVAPDEGRLFALEASTLTERRAARKNTISSRVAECAAMVSASDRPWIVWTELNAEGDALRALIPGAVEIRGSDDLDDKEKRLIDFAEGRIRVLITKPKIAGAGLNWQHCADMSFVGVNDSFERWYQAIRRCWRFGQSSPVNVHVHASDLEGAVVANLKRKEDDASEMADALSAATRAAIDHEGGSTRHTNIYQPQQAVSVPAWLTSEAE